MVRREGRSLYVRYESPLGGIVRTAPSMRPKTALHRFEAAIQADLTYTL